MPTKPKLDWDEAKEIADFLTKTDNPDEDYEITENALFEKWNIDVDSFHEIANGIFEMIDFAVSPLTQTPFVGISKGDHWLAKKKVDQQFIGGLIQWATEGELIRANGKGSIKEITLNGKPEFEIIIRKPESKNL